jgi:Cys-tRNA(Pro)/Cys-tRNA(Cys) deacylase
MPISTPASRALDTLGLPYRLFEHLELPASLEEAALQRGQVPAQVIRSIVFRLGVGQYTMVLMSGPGQISWKHLRTALNVSRISMASETEVLECTGYVRGAVTPLGLPAPMRILADEGIFSHEEISIGSGLKGVAVIMKSIDLRSALGSVEMGKFSEEIEANE